MKLFTYQGIAIKADKLFLLLLVFLSFTNVLPQALIMFAVVLIHEMSHILKARSYQVNISEVVLFPFGGVAKLDFLDVDSSQEIGIALAGPLCNFFMVGIALIAYYHYPAGYWLSFFIRLNLVMGLFNLLPILPLDGGRIYRACYAKRIGVFEATKRAVQHGKAVTILLIFVSVCGLYLKVWDLNPVLMAVFLFYCAGEQDRTATFYFLRYLLKKKEVVAKGKVLNLRTLYSQEDVQIKEVLPYISSDNYHLFYLFDQEGRLMYQISEEQLINGFFKLGDSAPLSKI